MCVFWYYVSVPREMPDICLPLPEIQTMYYWRLIWDQWWNVSGEILECRHVFDDHESTSLTTQLSSKHQLKDLTVVNYCCVLLKDNPFQALSVGYTSQHYVMRQSFLWLFSEIPTCVLHLGFSHMLIITNRLCSGLTMHCVNLFDCSKSRGRVIVCLSHIATWKWVNIIVLCTSLLVHDIYC